MIWFLNPKPVRATDTAMTHHGILASCNPRDKEALSWMLRIILPAKECQGQSGIAAKQ